MILVYNLWGSWTALTLGVTFACGYVFVVTALAGALMPYRAKALYEASPGAAYKIGNIPMVTIFGLIGAIVGGVMVLMFMFSSALGLTSVLAYQVVFGVLAWRSSGISWRGWSSAHTASTWTMPSRRSRRSRLEGPLSIGRPKRTVKQDSRRARKPLYG